MNKPTNLKKYNAALDFHKKIIRGYKMISKNNRRFIMIDAEKSFDEIHHQLQNKIISTLSSWNFFK